MGGRVQAQQQADDSSSQPTTEIPVFWNGDNFRTDMKNGIYYLNGNARFIRGDDSVFCDELVVYMTPERQVEKAIAKGNVRILTQEVTAAGDEGTFYLDEQKVELEGHAKAGQGNNTITAHRIVAWLDRNGIEGYGSEGTERVVMTIYSEPVDETSTPEAQPENTDPQQPSLITIESNVLTYDEAQGFSLFTGKVNARQNGMAIQSDEMRVYLADSQESGKNEIERIEVMGNVRIVQDTFIVTGEEGVFLNAEQSAVIKGTEEQQARAENSAEKSILNADMITILLESDDIQAKGNVSFETVLSEPAAEANP